MTGTYSPFFSGPCAACRAENRACPRFARWARTHGATLLPLCDTHKRADEVTGGQLDAVGIARATRNGGVR